MAKQLVVTVKAVDQLSPVMRGVIDRVMQFARRILDSSRRVMSALTAPLRALTSIRGMLLTFTAGVGIRRLVGSFNQATEAIDDMAKASQRLGISVEQLSSLKHAAELAGSSFEGLLDGFETLAKNAGQFAATGGGRAADAFGLLGSRVREAARAGVPLNELIAQIADGINAVGDASQRQFIVQRLFGENGSEWLTLLREGGDRLRAFNEEARRLNAIISPEQARIAEEYRDSITRIQSAWLGLRATLLQTIGPTLTHIMNRIAEFLAAVPEMIGNVMRTIRESFGQGEAAQRARNILGQVLTSLGDTVKEGVKSLVRIAGAALYDGIRFLGELLLPLGRELAAKIFIKPALDVIESVLPARFAGAVIGMRATVDGMIGVLTKANVQKALHGAFGEETLIAEETAKAAEEMRARFAGLTEALDELFGASEALAKTALPQLQAQLKVTTDAVAVTEVARFVDGWKQGMGDWLARARDTLNQARELAGNVMDAIAGSMTSAFNDIIQGTKSLAAAFRTMLSNILRQVSELIVQLLVVRAIASAVGVFGGGGNSPATVGGGGFKPGTGFGAVQRFAEGGVLAPFSGGIGRIVTRPEIFPMARGYGLRGERGPEAVLPLTRIGGRLGVDASGGGSVVNIDVTVNVAPGGHGDPAAIRRAVLEGVKAALPSALPEALHKNPGLRDDLRWILR